MKQIISKLVKHKRQITFALVLAFCAAITDQLVPRLLRDLMDGLVYRKSKTFSRRFGHGS